jgi:hypothetical protein
MPAVRGAFSTFPYPATRRFLMPSCKGKRARRVTMSRALHRPTFAREAVSNVTRSDNAGVDGSFEVTVPPNTNTAPAIPQQPSGHMPTRPYSSDAVAYTNLERVAPTRRLAMTGAEQFWYVLQCIAFGAGYFAKIPTKKALSEAGLVNLTTAEGFWYVLQCICFGAGYFAKVPVKKALSEAGLVRPTSPEQFWYVLQCVAFGAGYFAKLPTRKALDDAALLPMTTVGQFWYVLQCISFGAGYFNKVPVKKALSELATLPLTPAEQQF